jgi:hypothetical protein
MIGQQPRVDFRLAVLAAPYWLFDKEMAFCSSNAKKLSLRQL